MCAIVQLCIVEESFSMHHLYFSIAVHLGRSFGGENDGNLEQKAKTIALIVFKGLPTIESSINIHQT